MYGYRYTLTDRDSRLIDAALEAAAVQIMQADTGDEGEYAEAYEHAAQIVRAQKRGA